MADIPELRGIDPLAQAAIARALAGETYTAVLDSLTPFEVKPSDFYDVC